MKCKMCGKEITRNDRLCYCSVECYEKGNKIQNKIRLLIKKTAKKYNFEIKNEDKILNAKFLLFKNDDVKRCPCDANNPDRFCGSAQCIADVVYKGHCHCSLFWSKKEPLLKDNEMK